MTLTQRRSRAAAPLLALATALALTACGGDDDAGTAAPEPTGGMNMSDMSASPDAEADVDRDFLVAMVPHHQSASDMARIAVTRATNPQVKALAQRIIDAQGAEIEQMTTLAREEYGTTPSTEMAGPMSHEMMGMTMTMDMASDLAELESSSTPDKTFLQMMIPHHASAIMMADEVIKNGSNAGVKAIAEKIRADQANEIGEMQGLLEQLG